MKILALLPAVALCAVPALGQGLAPGTGSFGFNIGWNIPEGDYGSVVDSGYNGSFDFTYNLSPIFALRTEFGRASNNISGSKWLNVSGASGTSYNYNLTENAIYTFNPEGPANFYAMAGVGGATAHVSIGSYTGYGWIWDPWYGYIPVSGYHEAVNRSTTRLTYNGGFGVQFKISPSFLMSVESRYTVVATQHDIQYIPISIGFRWY